MDIFEDISNDLYTNESLASARHLYNVYEVLKKIKSS